MRLTNSINGLKILGESEMSLIIETALKILKNTGFIIENNDILELLEGYGARTDRSGQKVFIRKSLTEEFLLRINRKTRNDLIPYYTAEAEIYNGYFLDEETENQLPDIIRQV